jgi:transposase
MWGFSGGLEAGRFCRHDSEEVMTAAGFHLSTDELEARVRAAETVVERTHFQVIWLLAKGRSTRETAEITALSERWVDKLAERYARRGVGALGDQRRGNRGARPLLSDEDLEALRARLQAPPDDGGQWTGPKVALWIAARLGLEHVHPPRGWEALKKLRWSIQAPRPRNPKAANSDEETAFKKSLSRSPLKKRASTRTRRSRSGPPTNTASA